MSETDLKRERLHRDALRRLRRMERAALAQLMAEEPASRGNVAVLDSERYAAPLLERLGPRERIQLLLWGMMLVVFGFAAVSFFSAPLMDSDLAVSALLVLAMLFLSHMM